ncbi:MAG: hypothetical protein HAW60_06145, partial [Bdellovibrionales bacterium]|nr:hypothetical protein [Bdellovibrionales bacterium]
MFKLFFLFLFLFLSSCDFVYTKYQNLYPTDTRKILKNLQNKNLNKAHISTIISYINRPLSLSSYFNLAYISSQKISQYDTQNRDQNETQNRDQNETQNRDQNETQNRDQNDLQGNAEDSQQKYFKINSEQDRAEIFNMSSLLYLYILNVIENKSKSENENKNKSKSENKNKNKNKNKSKSKNLYLIQFFSFFNLAVLNQNNKNFNKAL